MPTPREEATLLLNEARRAAGIMLRGGRGFRPFSLVMAPDGGIRLVRAVLGAPDEPPRPIEEEAAYAQHVLRQMADKKEIKGVATIGIGTARFTGKEGPVTVIIVDVEHEAEPAVTLYFPFEWQPDGEPVMQKPASRRREAIIFPPAKPAGPATDAVTTP